MIISNSYSNVTKLEDYQSAKKHCTRWISTVAAIMSGVQAGIQNEVVDGGDATVKTGKNGYELAVLKCIDGSTNAPTTSTPTRKGERRRKKKELGSGLRVTIQFDISVTSSRKR